jgi:hypothetical protein
VYALTPREGSLEDLATAQKQRRKEARKLAEAEQERRKEAVEEKLDWRALMRQNLRKALRERGIRVR